MRLGGANGSCPKTYSNMGVFGMFVSLRCCPKISSCQQLLGDKCPYAYDAKDIHFGTVYCMPFVYVLVLSFFSRALVLWIASWGKCISQTSTSSSCITCMMLNSGYIYNAICCDSDAALFIIIRYCTTYRCVLLFPWAVLFTLLRILCELLVTNYFVSSTAAWFCSYFVISLTTNLSVW